MGYALGGINWDVTFLGNIIPQFAKNLFKVTKLAGELLGGHVRAVFTLITVIFVVCVSYTVTSFNEMPLALLEMGKVGNGVTNQSFSEEVGEKNYGSLQNTVERVLVYFCMIFLTGSFAG